MELFTKLFAAWLVFTDHCFDRIVLSGYLMGLQRPGQVVCWLQQVLGVVAITKDVLSQRTQDYLGWVESYARNRKIPLEWAEKDQNNEAYVLPCLRRLERQNRYGRISSFKRWSKAGPNGRVTGWWRGRPAARLISRFCTSTGRAIVTSISVCGTRCWGR
jgi:hypothetical protein